LVLAAGLSVTASGASAVIYDFNNDGPDNLTSIDFGAFSVTASAGGILNVSASVSQTSGGLGVNGSPDLQPGQMDGAPLGSWERLTFDFGQMVEFTGLTLSLFDADDEYNVYVDGNLVGTSNSASWAGSVMLSSFAIEAVGDAAEGDGVVFAGLRMIPRFDDFRVSSISYELSNLNNVVSTPLPASALLLIGALGGLALIRRRKTA
jgi:hypothetical protein